MDDLIEMLRRLAEWPDEADPVTIGAIAGEAADALEAAREDAKRWRHARKLLTFDDIEGAQGAYESFGKLISEDECKRADAAIDQARGKGVADEA